MAQKPTITIPTLAEFLAYGLSPHTPTNLDTECSICTVSWHDDPIEVVALPCRHEFHKECIEHWMREGVSRLATCPCCRLELCRRPDLPVQAGSWVTMESRVEEFVVWSELDGEWEGLDDAMEQVREQFSNIDELTRRIWEENDLGWAALVCKILAAYDTRGEQPLVPGSVIEYAVVMAILEALRHCWLEEELEVSELEAALDFFDDCVEHADNRSIDEAYLGAGLVGLAVRMERHRPDLLDESLFYLETSCAHGSLPDVELPYA